MDYWAQQTGKLKILFVLCILSTCTRRPRTRDYRTRRDRTQRRVKAFDAQLPALVEAYMEWMLQLGKDGYSGEYNLKLPPGAEVQATTNIYEVDVYRKSTPFVFSFIF